MNLRELNICEMSALAGEAARKIAELVRQSAKSRDRACLALAGGTTPRAVHEALAALPDVPWEKVHVFFGDERAVPPDHSDSNYRMARESLLSRVAIPSSQVHRPEAEAPDRDAAARAYERVLPEVLDIVVLGIGEDGHTASLFPGAASLNEKARRYIPVVGPKPPPHRLTITPPVLAAAPFDRDARRRLRKGGCRQACARGRLGPGGDTLPARPRRHLVFGSRGGGGALVMLSEAEARAIAHENIEAWNSRDLERILAHYEDDVVLVSPVAALRFGDPSGEVRGKAQLRTYFEGALAANPELHFELVDVMWGIRSVVLYYKNQRGTMTGEVLEISARGRVERVLANYSAPVTR